MPSSDCDHIVGSNEMIGGDWLLFQSDRRVKADRVFHYCPLCGAKLKEPPQSDEHEEMTHG
jgi:hypothetical protein